MRISPEVEIALSLAANEAARRRHEYFTLEHLLYALLFDEGTAQVVRHAGGDPASIKKELEGFLTDQLESVPEEAYTTPTASLGVQRAIRRALTHVQSKLKGIGRRTPIQVRIDDPQRVSKVRVELVQGTEVKTVKEQDMTPRSAWAFGSVPPLDMTVDVGRETVQGLRSGEATVRVTAEPRRIASQKLENLTCCL